MISPPPSPPGEEEEEEEGEGEDEEEDHGEEAHEEDPDSAPIGYPYGLYSPFVSEERADGNVVFELNTDGAPRYPSIEEMLDEVFEGDSESGRSVGHNTPSPPPVSGQPAPTARVAAIFGPSFTPQVVPPSRGGTEGMRSGYAPSDANVLTIDSLRETISDIGRRTAQTEAFLEGLAFRLQASIRHNEEQAASPTATGQRSRVAPYV